MFVRAARLWRMSLRYVPTCDRDLKWWQLDPHLNAKVASPKRASAVEVKHTF
jgi:hypothetical protein